MRTTHAAVEVRRSSKSRSRSRGRSRSRDEGEGEGMDRNGTTPARKTMIALVMYNNAPLPEVYNKKASIERQMSLRLFLLRAHIRCLSNGVSPNTLRKLISR